MPECPYLLIVATSLTGYFLWHSICREQRYQRLKRDHEKMKERVEDQTTETRDRFN